MFNKQDLKKIIENFISKHNLSTRDLYDIWLSNFGIKTKKLFYNFGLIRSWHRIFVLYLLEFTGLIKFWVKKREYLILRKDIV